MSRLGKMPVALPKGVEVNISTSGEITVKGPKGTLKTQLPSGIRVNKESDQLVIECDEKSSHSNINALHGLYRSLIKNHIQGVTTGFEVRLSLIGVGYRAAVTGHKLELQVGFSHPTFFEIPKTITVTVDKGTLVIISGIDKHLVGQFAATVRALKAPEPYKGKGIRYENEYVRKKEGKAAKAAAK